jgi:thiol-disulfide isomerase/thioredoxin
MEALISRMMALGPAANLPPHIWLEPAVPRSSLTLYTALVMLLAGCDRAAPDAAQESAGLATASSGAALAAKSKGVAAIDRSHAGEPMPALQLVNPATQEPFDPATLAGKPVLLNLWATWCAPCVKEMPLLEALAGEERRLKVLTASQDLGGPDKVLTYFEKERFQRIEPWLDKEGELGFHFGGGLPVSVLYDAQGREVWRVTGDLDWADPQVRGAIDEALPAA